VIEGNAAVMFKKKSAFWKF